jgi:hypothetical protein
MTLLCYIVNNFFSSQTGAFATDWAEMSDAARSFTRGSKIQWSSLRTSALADWFQPACGSWSSGKYHCHFKCTSSLKMELICSSETPVSIFKTTRSHCPIKPKYMFPPSWKRQISYVTYLCIYVNLSIYLSTYQTIYPTTHPSSIILPSIIYLLTYLLTHPSTYITVCSALYICLCIYLPT